MKKRAKRKMSLAEIGRAYERNWKRLVAAHDAGDTEQHKKYLAKERMLNKLDEQKRSSLGILIPNPCPLTSGQKNKLCRGCTGYFKKFGDDYLQCEENDVGSFVCKLEPRKLLRTIEEMKDLTGVV